MSNEKYGAVEGFFVTVFGAVFAALFIAAFAILMLPIAMLTAWVRWLMWGWFVVPYLHLPMVPYWAVLGLGLLVGTFTTTDQPNGYKPTTKEQATRFLTSIAVQITLLGIGYIVHHYLLH
jgi:hypothetical protein